MPYHFSTGDHLSGSVIEFSCPSFEPTSAGEPPAVDSPQESVNLPGGGVAQIVSPNGLQALDIANELVITRRGQHPESANAPAQLTQIVTLVKGPVA